MSKKLKKEIEELKKNMEELKRENYEIEMRRKKDMNEVRRYIETIYDMFSEECDENRTVGGYDLSNLTSRERRIIVSPGELIVYNEPEN